MSTKKKKKKRPVKKKRVVKKRRSLKNRLLTFLLKSLLLLLLTIALFIFSIYLNLFGEIPNNTELRSIKNETATLVYSNDNHLLGKYFSENRINITWEEAPEYLIQALISTEDSRYFKHNGFDSRSYMRVLIKTLILGDRHSGGGSTITQQLAKNLFGRPNYGFLTIPINKIKEAIVAYRLEHIYTKKEILILYLNTVPFGENVYGIEAAANRFFNKKTKNLNIQESAVLVGILKANTYYNPHLNPDNAIKRRNLVLSLMMKNGYISNEYAQRLKHTPLKLDYANYNIEGPANYFLHQVKKQAKEIITEYNTKTNGNIDIEKNGLKITTTLDYKLQQKARESIKEHLKIMQSRLDKNLNKNNYLSEKTSEKKKLTHVFTWDGIKTKNFSATDSLWHYLKMLHAGMFAIEPTTGEVKIWIGGNYYRYMPYDLVLAKRPAASTFKPFLYTAALENGLTPCSYLNNKQKVYEEYDNWEPKNYDKTSGGYIAMWYALMKSMNIPTVDLYFKTGHKNLEHTTSRLGITPPLPKGPSVALGVKEMSLKEIVRAYAAFAADGMLPDIHIIKKIEDNQGNIIYQSPETKRYQAITTQTTEQLNTMLINTAKNGTGRSLYSVYNIKSEIAAKTGTNQDFKDARFVFYNKNIVAGIWVGAMNPKIHFNNGYNGSGSTLALPIAGRFIKKCERDKSLRRYFANATPRHTEIDFNKCPGKKDTNIIKDFIDILSGDIHTQPKEKNNNTQTTKDKKKKKKKGFLNWLFGKK